MAGKSALIIGAGPGISLAFGKKLAESGYKVCLASRNLEKLQLLATSIGADAVTVDCSSNDSIVALFEAFDKKFGTPDVVLYNPSAGFAAAGPCGTIDYNQASAAMQITALGAFVTCQEAGKRMALRGSGAIFLSGASAAIKAWPNKSVFAMGKFAQRALAQSMYKELSPKGIHVCHFVLDGGVRPWPGETLETLPEGAFTAEAIAESYMLALKQPKGAWSWEQELRSQDEKF